MLWLLKGGYKRHLHNARGLELGNGCSMIVEKLVEWTLPGETVVLGGNLPQRHFVHHKSHVTRPGIEPVSPR
jgi:hypothetical protein